jgi:rsbT co-antagonist protein RsbR
MTQSKIPSVLAKYEASILTDWLREQSKPEVTRDSLIQLNELQAQCQEFLALLINATRLGGVTSISTPAFLPVKELLSRISTSRSEQGFTPAQTAVFVFSLKRPLFDRLREECAREPELLFDEIWAATELLDLLGLYTTETYQKSREAVISHQQAEMLELSTPVVKLWDGILALPLIGTLDSNRTQIVMETLLQRIVETNSEVAIIDITGVPTVDTLVAQHLMKTVAAARLMGVECIISGIRPQIAQTIVHLGVALGEVPTKSTLAAAFRLALRRIGMNTRSNSELKATSARKLGELE